MLKDNEIGTFESWPYHVPTFAEEKSKFEALTKAFQEAKSGPEALAVYQKMTELSDHLQDDVTHIQVLFSLETQNPTYQKDMDSLNQELPLFTVEQQKFMKAMLSSPYRSYLEEKLGKFLFEKYEYSFRSFDDRVVEEAQEEADLVTQYDAAVAKTNVSFRGKTYNLPQMGKFLSSPDYPTRHEAAEAYYQEVSKHVDEWEDYYDKLVKVRVRMAKKLGYSSYTELAYYRMERYDYTPGMVKEYRDAIRKVVTPLADRLVHKQLERLNLKNPDLVDANLYFSSGNPLPKGSTEEKVQVAIKMYDSMSPDTSYFFRFMVDHHLLFLEAKPGKQGGGYMTEFPVHRCPIIFSNFNGTSGDVDVLTHEFGHSFQYFEARDIAVPEYRMPTAESCEIDSMSMEFFAEPYMHLFFDDPDGYRYLHLADAIKFLPYGVTVDEFQHWVYDHPEATSKERDEEWQHLEETYTPWKVRLEQNIPYLKGGHRWLTQAHIFDLPFYYIDYTLAQVIAFEFLERDRANHEAAWHTYLKLCKMGGQYPFLTLLEKAGLDSPFQEGVLEKTISPLEAILDSYHPTSR